VTDRIRGRALQARRERHKRSNPLCVRCQAKGIVRPWTQLDHVKALVNGGTDTDDNLQGLCDDCHAAKTAEDMGQTKRQTIGTDGWPVGGYERSYCK
jgi:5-methylcytosine-specific restriction protein A